MKLSTLLLATCFLSTAFGQVQVANPGFAEDEIFCNGCFYPAITGWVAGPNSGVQKATPADFPGGIPGGSPNYAYVGNANSTGSISQVVGTTVKANRTYTLKMSIGQRGTFTGYVAALMANGVMLASDSSLRPSPNTFSEETIVFNSGPSPAQIGFPLSIFVKSHGNGQVDIANVSLTVQ